MVKTVRIISGKQILRDAKKALKIIKQEAAAYKATQTAPIETDAPIAIETDAPIAAIETDAVKAETLPPFTNIKFVWDTKITKGLTTSITKNKLASLLVITDVSKFKAIGLIETLGFNTLKNQGNATLPGQKLVKNTQVQAWSYYVEFAKCLNNKGNTKTTKAYLSALTKLTPYDIEYFAKVSGIDMAVINKAVKTAKIA